MKLGTELVYAFAAAYLRGAVLRQLLPNFPMLTWSAVVISYLTIFPLISALSASGVRPAPGELRYSDKEDHSVLPPVAGFASLQ